MTNRHPRRTDGRWPGSQARAGGRGGPLTSPAGAVPGAADQPGAALGPGTRPAAGWPAGRIASAVALPLADMLALAAAVPAAGRPGRVSALYALAVFAILTGTGQHRLRICLRAADQAGPILTAVALPLLILLPWIAESGPQAVTVARQAIWSAGLVIAFRVAACAVLRAARRRGLLTEPALIVGVGTFGAHIAELIRERPELGLRLAGYLDGGPPRRDLPLQSLGTLGDLADVVARLRIGRVIVCYAGCKDEDLVTVLRPSQPLRADVCVVPRLYELGAAVPRACLDEIWGIPLIPLRRPGCRSLALAAKRAFDVVGAAVLLAAAAPVLLASAAAIRLQSGRPALFRQTRITTGGGTAQILKLRTLGNHGDPDTCWTVPEQHCTALGRWLRATHADELPQLVNVLRGEMSLVGPRPERPYFAERFGREIRRYSDRTRMPSGLTGWAQVHGLNGNTSIVERARFDNQYIEYWSPWLDVLILGRTLGAALPGLRAGRR
jgi:exopolysaccharide biosynthesis polyprenyl glycosylphosphotransferase